MTLTSGVQWKHFLLPPIYAHENSSFSGQNFEVNTLAPNTLHTASFIIASIFFYYYFYNFQEASNQCCASVWQKQDSYNNGLWPATKLKMNHAEKKSNRRSNLCFLLLNQIRDSWFHCGFRGSDAVLFSALSLMHLFTVHPIKPAPSSILRGHHHSVCCAHKEEANTP